MAEDKKMQLVAAFLLVALLMTSSSVPAADTLCFPDCHIRCANGKIGDVACSNMCSQACIVPTETPYGIDLASLVPGGQ